jgi:hypothetical protein
MIVHVNF